MKTRILGILLAILMVVTAITLGGCEFLFPVDPPTDENEESYRAIYRLYVDYSENNGEEPQDYEEWLAEIRGEDGKDGKDGKDGEDAIAPRLRINEKNNHWEISTDGGLTWKNLGVKATGNDGLNGLDGKDGVSPHIGEDGNWWIGSINTGIAAKGESGSKGEDGVDGITPQLRIVEGYWEVSYDNGETWISLGVAATGPKGDKGDKGDQGEPGEKGETGENGKTPYIQDGYWYIDGVNTGVKAEGSDGEDGEDLTACEHSFGEWIVDLDPTCDSIGVNYRTCEKCNKVEHSYVEKLGHTLVDVYTMVNSCKQHTVMTKCTVCNSAFIEDREIEAEHTVIIDPRVEPTCTTSGLTEGSHCSVCGVVIITQETIYGEHDLVVVEAKEPTCIDIGWDTYEKCKNCDYSTYVEKAATGEHTWFETPYPPTCTENGYTVFHCEVCFTRYTVEHSTGPMHSFGSWYVVEEPTCEKEGLERRDCQICEHYETNTIEMVDHNYVDGNCEFCGVTSDEYFVFTLLGDDTYSIKAKDVNNMPSNVVIPSTYNGKAVTVIAISAFYNCSSLTSVVIGDNVKTIEDNAFYACTSLSSIKMSSSLLSIGYQSFYYCKSLTELILPESIKTIDNYAFLVCSSLTYISLPDNMTSIGGNAFQGCSSLSYNYYDNAYYLGNEMNPYSILIGALDKSITNCNIHKDTTMLATGAFLQCVALDNVIIPENVTSLCNSVFSGCSSLSNIVIGNNVNNIGDSAFYGCTSLLEIIIPNGVTSIGNSAFSDCSSLVNITLPDSLTFLGEWTFRACNSLKNIFVGNNINEIGDCTFFYCYNLERIIISNSISIIGERVFWDCEKLKYIDFYGTVEEWQSIEKGANWDYNTNSYTVFCSNGTITKDGTVTYK